MQKSQLLTALSTFAIGSLIIRFGFRDGMSAPIADNVGWLIFSALAFTGIYIAFPRLIRLLRPATR